MFTVKMKFQILILSLTFLSVSICEETVVPAVADAVGQPDPAVVPGSVTPANLAGVQAAIDPAAANQTVTNGIPSSQQAAQQSWVNYYNNRGPFVTYRRPYSARQYQYYGQYHPSAVAAAAATAAATSCQNDNNVRNAEDEKSKFERWYLESKDHDIEFLVCGTLIPAHKILLEASSEVLANLITERTVGRIGEPIKIDSIKDLIPSTNIIVNCANDKFLETFKVFLKYFYTSNTVFNSIEDLESAMIAATLARAFIPLREIERIQPKAMESMTERDLTNVYRFASKNDLEAIKAKWFKYVEDNAEQLTASILAQNLPITCNEVENDVELLDNFLHGLNATQERVIQIIEMYLNTCPPSIKNKINSPNEFRNSILFYRCTIEDLKSLVRIGFITKDQFADELENRLSAQKRFCDELKKTSSTYYSHLRQMEPFIGIRR